MWHLFEKDDNHAIFSKVKFSFVLRNVAKHINSFD